MRTQFVIFSFAAIFAVGCAAHEVPWDPDEQETVIPAATEGKSDRIQASIPSSRPPIGTFIAGENVEFGDFEHLVLNADKTFERAHVCPPNARCALLKGTYKFTRSTKKNGPTYIRFYDRDGDAMDRYVYTYVNGILELRPDDETRTFRLAPDDCRSNGCDAGQNCQVCWSGFACVPDGALC